MKTYGNDPLECPNCRSKMRWDGIYDGKGENLGVKIRDKLGRKVQKEIREEKQIKFVCLDCGIEKLIPEGVVRTFDIYDDGDITEPPRFRCEECRGSMVPEDYTGVDGVHYTINNYR